MSIDSYSFCEDGFQARLIQGLLGNKPFFKLLNFGIVLCKESLDIGISIGF